MSSLKVVFLVPWYPSEEVPYAGIFFKQQALALTGIGVKVGVIHLDIQPFFGKDSAKRGSYRLLVQEGKVNELRLVARVPRLLRPWARYWAAKKLLEEYRRRFGAPDLLHAHVALWPGVVASFLPIPYVLTEHWNGYAEGLVQKWQVPLIRRAFHKAQVRLVVSSALAQHVKDIIGNLNIEVLPNAVDTSFFAPPISRPPYPPLRLVSVANLVKGKGLDTVIRAVGRLVQDGMDVVLDIGGDGPQRHELVDLVFKLGLEKRVNFLGALSGEGVRNAMQSAHLFVLPSEYETFGVVYVEALACGLPVIATANGGPQDFITPEVGLLVQPKDEVALAEAIARIWQNYANYQPQQLHRYAEQNFGYESFATRLTSVYEQAIAKGGVGVWDSWTGP